MKKHLLFVCSSNLDRSPCAESLFEKNKKFEAKSAGLWTSKPAVELNKQLIEWADVIFVMDEIKEGHRTELLRRFPEAYDKEIIILDINNNYVRNDPKLKELLKARLKKNI